MLKRYFLFFAIWVSFAGICQAAQPPLPASKPADAVSIGLATEKGSPVKKDKDAAVTDRFVQIFADETYTYYLDVKTAQRIACPYRDDEQLIDVWVKLVEPQDTAYQYPQTYILEHYYLRPAKKQIQLLCEAEIVGRPTNDLVPKPYLDANWENIVPGSVEDSLYQVVIEKMKVLSPEKKIKKSGGSNFFDNVLRIAM